MGDDIGLSAGPEQASRRRDPAPFRFAEGVGLFFIQPMVRLPNAALEGVIHASPVSHCEADRPAAGCAAEDHKPDPNGFQRPRQCGVR
jgi:hypothetical protein